MTGVFVAGTDSNVGKTFITCGLANALRQAGTAVATRKPIEQYCKRRGGALYPEDGLALARAAGAGESIDVVTPYPIRGGIDPTLTTPDTKAGAINLDALIDAVQQGPAATFRVVEGAGGLLSPLAIDGSNADLAEALGFPLVIVTADRAGCINHVRLTVEAAERRGLSVVGVVVNVPEPETAGAGDYRDALAALLDIPVIAHSHGHGDWDASSELARLAIG